MIYRYLLEIKYRTFFSLIAWIFMVIICYYFKEILLYIFIKPNLSITETNSFYFLTTNVAEVFTTYIQLSYFISNQILTIFLIYQILIFISTGLYEFEYYYLKTLVMIITIFWGILIILLNNFIFPTSWFFFFKFQNFSKFEELTFCFEAKLSEYLSFYKSIYFVCCSVYQIIVLFCIVLNTFKTDLSVIKNFRKIFYFVFFFFATLITPPEVIYQLIASICIILIYELIVFYAVLKTKFNAIK